MTEKEFYRSLLAKAVGDKQQLLADAKHRPARKKTVRPWVQAVAAVFCVVLIGGVGLAAVHQKNGLKTNEALPESCAGYDRADGIQETAAVQAAGQENGTMEKGDEETLTQSTQAGAENRSAWLQPQELRALVRQAEQIVIAKADPKQGTVTVTQAIRGAHSGQVLKAGLDGAAAGGEYLLLLIREGDQYVELLSSQGKGPYRADSQAGIYWPSADPSQPRPITEIEAWAADPP